MSDQKTLLASELLEQLETMLDEHGDKPVYLDDPDTGYLLGVNLHTGERAMWEPDADVFLITADYHKWPS